ncbi:flagellar hook-associated protein FlgL [Calditrichota bacterium]
MRITHHTLVDNVIYNVNKRMAEIEKRQNELSTGIRVDKPSTDPVAAGEMIQLQSRIDRVNQYKRNIESGLSQMRSGESAMQEISDLMRQARSLALQGANGTLSAGDRSALAAQVEGLLGSLLEIANRDQGNHYLFGGTETSETPYEAVLDANGYITGVTKNFSTEESEIELIFSEDKRSTVSVGATEVFELSSGGSIFDSLLNLKSALENNDPDAVGSSLDSIDEALKQTNDMAAMLGVRVSAANSLMDRLDTREVDLSSRLATIADVDLVEAITRLDEEQNMYELGLRTSAKVIQPSLVNFVYL